MAVFSAGLTHPLTGLLRTLGSDKNFAWRAPHILGDLEYQFRSGVLWHYKGNRDEASISPDSSQATCKKYPVLRSGQKQLGLRRHEY